MIILPALSNKDVTRLFIPSPTLSGAVEKYLRDAIVKGEFGPGSPLREIELRDQLEVSNTPIRDALNALAEQGLVDIEPNKRKRVSLLDAVKTLDVLRVHLPIWRTAFKWAYSNMTDTHIARLMWELDGCDYAIERGRKVDAVEALARFHDIVLSACHSNEISRLLSSRKSLIARHILLQASDLLAKQTTMMFRQMINAISNQDQKLFSRHHSLIGRFLLRRFRLEARIVQRLTVKPS
jgi:DNA-binding GntR family transcriptional regulator